MPRGPVNADQALVAMAFSVGVGLAAGYVMRSRWAMLITPLAFILAYELARSGIRGASLETIRFDSPARRLTAVRPVVEDEVQSTRAQQSARLFCASSICDARQEERSMSEKEGLYDRLGGVFAIAAVVDHFSDAIVKNAIVGQVSSNPALREWHTQKLGRLPGLKYMRTLWLCEVAGGPFQFSPTKAGAAHLGLEEAHREFHISPEEFDEVAAELGRSLDFFGVPDQEKQEVLAAFAAHKQEVVQGSLPQPQPVT